MPSQSELVSLSHKMYFSPSQETTSGRSEYTYAHIEKHKCVCVCTDVFAVLQNLNLLPHTEQSHKTL